MTFHLNIINPKCSAGTQKNSLTCNTDFTLKTAEHINPTYQNSLSEVHPTDSEGHLMLSRGCQGHSIEIQ